MAPLFKSAIAVVCLITGSLAAAAQTRSAALDLDLAAGQQGLQNTPDARTGDTVTLQLTLLVDPGPFSQLEADLTYDARSLTPVGSRAVGRYADAVTVPAIAAGAVTDIGVKFAYAILGSTIHGPTDLMEIDFRVEEGFAGQTEVALVRLSLGPTTADREVFSPDSRVVLGSETAIVTDETAPLEFDLQPNYPNPFNAHTVINYSIDRAGPVELDVLDLLGRTVRHLVSGRLASGAHAVNWDARDDGGRPVATGVYVIRLQAGDRHESHRATVLK